MCFIARTIKTGRLRGRRQTNVVQIKLYLARVNPIILLDYARKVRRKLSDSFVAR